MRSSEFCAAVSVGPSCSARWRSWTARLGLLLAEMIRPAQVAWAVPAPDGFSLDLEIVQGTSSWTRSDTNSIRFSRFRRTAMP